MAKFPEFDWKAKDLSEQLTLFKERMELYLLDGGIADEVKKATKIKLAIGDEGLRRINASGMSADDKKNPVKIWKLLTDQLKTQVNYRIHRLEMMNFRQKSDETLDQFVHRCREKATDCDFRDEELAERIMELVICSTPMEPLQRELLSKPKGFTVDELLTEGRRFEAICQSRVCLQSLGASDKQVDAISRRDTRTCGNCGLSHPPRKCPAYNDTCNACKALGHWAPFCRKTARKRDTSRTRRQSHHKSTDRHRGRSQSGNRHRRRHKSPYNKGPRKDRSVSTLDVDQAQDPTATYTKEFFSVSVCSFEEEEPHRKSAFTTLHVQCPKLKGTHRLKLKIDTGADGNTLPVRTMCQMYGDSWKTMVQPTSARLRAYNGSPIKCHGELDILCKTECHGWSRARFYVVDVDGPAVLGLPTCEHFNIITINELTGESETSSKPSPPKPIKSVRDLKKMFPDQFDKIGSFKTPAKLHLKPDAQPTIDAPRKCSIHIRDKLKQEIDKMEADGIIKKVEHHTDWCSSITTATKKDGSLRVCLDPRRLNQNLKRCPHKIPTLEEITPAFAKAKYFSKLDAKAGYWSVHLDPESQELTTFRTPFGRYCFRRLPFGLNVSQDIFQQHMDQILEKVSGADGIADDVVVHGATEEEHDENLIHLMNTAKEEGLVFNSDKCIIKAEGIDFFGSLYTKDGVRPDLRKVEDIKQMPTPQDKEDLQRFLGMMTYLSPYIPKYSDKAAILRDLTKSDVPFVWHEDHQRAFEILKDSINPESALQYFDPNKPTALEVDASMKGLGACLSQDGKPIAFASKSLTNAEKNYSNIERETLAMVFGITRFHTYLFGKHFTVVTDHKPLVMIHSKPLTSAPPRLQRLLIKIQGYDFDIIYQEGKKMVLSDTLSRLPNPQKNEEIPLDLHVDCVRIELIHHGADKHEELRTNTLADPVLVKLSTIIHTGWPAHLKDLPEELRPYWSFRDQLGIMDGIIFKGRQVIIPPSLREDILKQLHEGHLGIEKTRQLSRETVYWPNINRDIENMVKQCPACQELQPQQSKEPLITHDIPTYPWTKLGMDIFHVNQDAYILITDYTSKFPIVHRLKNIQSATVANICSDLFSLFGRPEEIMSDNGPEFAGQPFQDMCKEWGVTHTTSSPRYPCSNGLSERNVRTVKGIIKKVQKTGQDLKKALLNLRATPVSPGIPSPAEILLGRPIKTTLPSISQTSRKGILSHEKLIEKKEHLENKVNVHRVPLPPLQAGQKIRILDHNKRTWCPGTVTRVCEEPRSYEVTTPNGTTVRRNRSQLREIPAEMRRVTFEDETHHDKEPTPTPQETTPTEDPDGIASDIGVRRSGRVIRKPHYLADYVS